MQTTIYLIRHAQPQSHTPNGGLTDLGVVQAKRVAAKLRKKISGKQLIGSKPLLVVSPTNRTRQTADPIAKALHLRPLVHSAFSEKYLVDSKVSFLSPSFLAHHVAVNRIRRAFWQIVHKNKNKVIIIVTHGNVIRVLTGKLLHKSYTEMSNTPVTCGSITTFIVDGSRASLTTYEEI